MARTRASPLGEAFEFSLKFIAFLFALELADGVLVLGLDEFGIRPREMVGLRGVVVAPLLHGGLGHVAANAGPLCILLPLFLVDRRQRPCSWEGHLTGAVVGGIAAWRNRGRIRTPRVSPRGSRAR